MTVEKKSHILITGDRMGLGSGLAKKLLQIGHDHITLISNPYCPYIRESPEMETIDVQSGELLDLSFLSSLIGSDTIIYHTDIMFSFDRKLATFIYNHNVIGTKNIINIAVQKKVSKVVYIGSFISLAEKNRDRIELTDLIYQSDLEVHRGVAEGLLINSYYPGFILQPHSMTSLTESKNGQVQFNHMGNLIHTIIHNQTLPLKRCNWNDLDQINVPIENTIDSKAQINPNIWQRLTSPFSKHLSSQQLRNQFYSAHFY